MPRSTPVYLPGRSLSASELQCAVFDGELIALGEGFLPIDAPNTAFARAASLAPVVLDARVIISDRSAAWVWGWAAMPPAVTTCVSIAARIPSPDRRRLRAREVVIGAHEQLALGGVVVTTPLRTLLDLARHDAGSDLAALLERGIRQSAIGAHQFTAALTGRTNLSFVRRARRLLLEACGRASSSLSTGDADDGATQPLLTR